MIILNEACEENKHPRSKEINMAIENICSYYDWKCEDTDEEGMHTIKGRFGGLGCKPKYSLPLRKDFVDLNQKMAKSDNIDPLPKYFSKVYRMETKDFAEFCLLDSFL